ncbi:MAG: hypothetical protein H8E82_01965 [Candidatus Marinimicrobia bacterium]|nr:hypothetical protein [Candidatus Neomarinimicrobiota bacterium]MBL7046603.1 hypothetical protein [Candidatus Neomarinimicrobiota bacterium]
MGIVIDYLLTFVVVAFAILMVARYLIGNVKGSKTMPDGCAGCGVKCEFNISQADQSKSR